MPTKGKPHLELVHHFAEAIFGDSSLDPASVKQQLQHLQACGVGLADWPIQV